MPESILIVIFILCLAAYLNILGQYFWGMRPPVPRYTSHRETPDCVRPTSWAVFVTPPSIVQIVKAGSHRPLMVAIAKTFWDGADHEVLRQRWQDQKITKTHIDL
jgi:hypothetical protein